MRPSGNIQLPSDNNESFKIYKIQDMIRHLSSPLPLQRSVRFEILFVSAGRQTSRYHGLKRYDIQPGQLFFTAAGQISSGDIYDADFQGYLCLLEDDFLSGNGISNTPISTFPFFKHGHSALVDLTDEETDKFKDMFHVMHSIHEDSDNPQLLAAYMHVLLLEAGALHRRQENIAKSTNTSPYEQLTGKFLDLINEHHIKVQQVNKYAGMLHVTPNYLNKAVKHVTGKTSLEHIHEMQMLQAKVLLKQNEMNISEVAGYLSFDTPSYFIRLFKKYTGTTPLDFRKMGAGSKKS